MIYYFYFFISVFYIKIFLGIITDPFDFDHAAKMCKKIISLIKLLNKNKKTHKKIRLYIIQRILKSYYDNDDVPGEIRTPDRRLRRALLYPAELLGHIILMTIFIIVESEIKSQHFIIEKLHIKGGIGFPPLICFN